MIEDSTIASYYYRGSNLLLSFLFTHDFTLPLSSTYNFILLGNTWPGR